MEEIADFIANPTGKGESTPTDRRASIAETYRGIAKMYEQIAEDLEKTAGGDDGAEINSVDVLRKWVEQAKTAQSGKA